MLLSCCDRAEADPQFFGWWGVQAADDWAEQLASCLYQSEP